VLTHLTFPVEQNPCRTLIRSTAWEIMPAACTSAALDEFIRDGATTMWHRSGTAKMGQDTMALVDSRLRVYGTERLRIADASVMPRVPTRNTMAPCVIIGEQASRAIARETQV
jgi:choline dehydrogenase